MMNKTLRVYNLVAQFSQRLGTLYFLFRMPVETGDFKENIPHIIYCLHELRSLEVVLRRIFKNSDARFCFATVDAALYAAEMLIVRESYDKEKNLACGESIWKCSDRVRGLIRRVSETKLTEYIDDASSPKRTA